MSTNIKKEKGKFNIVDLFLLILIIAIIGTLAYIFISPYATDLFSTSYDINYTIHITGVNENYANYINVGDTVVETGSLKPIGEVLSVKSSPTQFVASDKTGKSVTSDYPGLIDLTVEVKATAIAPSGIYSVNEFIVTAGEKISFRVPNFMGTGMCVSVKEAE